MRKTILWLFIIALITRAIIALLQVRFGIDNQVNLDQYIYGPFNAGFEIYHDFYSYYVVQLADLSQGLLPYRDFAYAYPPLFLYVLYPFYSLAGQYAASIPIFVADAATASLVYLTVRHFTSERIAFLAGLSYAISPFFLLYEAYLWFSSQPMTFFLLLSIYLLLIKRPEFSAIIFAIAVLFKQETILILPVYLIWYYKENRNRFRRGLITILTIIFIFSLPFLIITPSKFIASMTYEIIDFGSAQASIPVSNQTYSLVCSSVSNTWRSLICNYGSFTYTDVKSIPPLTVLFSGPFLNTISIWIAVPLIALIAYYLFLLKRDGIILLLASSLALMIFITIFDFEVHSVLRYYLVPVYALIMASSENRVSLLLAAFIPVISLFLPSGSIELLPPLFTILLLLMIRYTKNSRIFQTHNQWRTITDWDPSNPGFYSFLRVLTNFIRNNRTSFYWVSTVYNMVPPHVSWSRNF